MYFKTKLSKLESFKIKKSISSKIKLIFWTYSMKKNKVKNIKIKELVSKELCSYILVFIWMLSKKDTFTVGYSYENDCVI